MFFSFFVWLSQLISQYFFAGYVSGHFTFPKPLGAAEEKEYLRLLKEGTEPERENARRVLIEHNMRLVAHIVKKYAPTVNADSEDLISIGTIGLIKAIDSFDDKKRIRLATYASRCIQNEILMLMRASRNKNREVSLQDPIGTDGEGNTISLLNIMYDESDDIADAVSLKMQIKNLYDRVEDVLTEREKEVVLLRYGLFGKKVLTQREIAKQLKISRSYVSRIETKAIKKLRDAMQEE